MVNFLGDEPPLLLEIPPSLCSLMPLSVPDPDENEVRPHVRWFEPAMLLAAAGLFFAVRRLLPLHEETLATGGLNGDRVRDGLAILSVTAFLWLTEALPVSATALLIPLMAVFFTGSRVESALAPFADPVLFLFFGGFVIAGTLRHHGLDRWLAGRLIAAAHGRFTVAALLMILATAVISMWISNTATAAMMLPLALGMAAKLELPAAERRRAEVFLLLGIAFAASVGGVGSLVGTPPNGVVAQALQLEFNDWFRFGLPAFALFLPALLAILLGFFRPSFSWRIPAETSAWRWTLPRILTLLVFAGVILAWLFSAPLAALLGKPKNFDTVVALCGVAAVCLLRLLPWKELERSVEWGVLLLFGGGLLLGRLLEETGASVFLARGFTVMTGGWPLVLLLLGLAAAVTLLSEFASNTAVATLMVPVFSKVALEMGLPPEKLVVPVGLAASCGFMMPVATPPNALVFGTGKVPQRDMIRCGLLLDAACVLCIGLLGWLVF